jgi:hypothetical protein
MRKLIQCSINTEVINKPQPDDKVAWKSLSKDWKNVDLSIEAFAAHINKGYSFCAQMLKRRNNANFIGTNVLTVDIDKNWTLEAALNDYYIKQFATVLYTTASHTVQHNKFRIVFLLDREIFDAVEMRAAYVGAIRKFGGDEACKDVCRLFFGSSGSNPIILGNTLPNEKLDELITLGKEVRLSEFCGDSESTDASAPVGIRSNVTLPLDLIVRLSKGGTMPLQAADTRTAIYCPIHTDIRHASAMVVVNKNGKRGAFCSKCGTTFWPCDSTQTKHEKYGFNHIIDLVRQLAIESKSDSLTAS